jgi:uncharacterized protein YegL
MGNLHQTAISCFNEFIDGQKMALGTADISLLLFDHEIVWAYKSVPLEQVPALNDDIYWVRGSTALYDAMGTGIDMLGKELTAMQEQDRPEIVLVVVFTDGMENASRKYTKSDIKYLIDHQRNHYNWDFMFLSSDPMALDFASEVHIDRAHIHQVENSKNGMEVAFNTVNSHIAYRRSAFHEKK